jgi:hypothetical protein
MALWSMALVGSTPVGAPIVGALSAAFNPRVGVAIGAAGCALAAGIGSWGTSRSQRWASLHGPPQTPTGPRQTV